MRHKNHRKIRVAVAEGQAAMREAICNQISSSARLRIVVEASDGDELINAMKKLKIPPDICMFEIVMPEKNGYDILKEIRDIYPSMKILIFTAIEHKHAIIRMYENGVNGYLFKNIHLDELVSALTAIHETGHYYTELITGILLNARNDGDGQYPKISGREWTFLSFLTKNWRYIKIAKEMYVAESTVYGYHKKLGAKLQLSTKAELTEYARSIGLSWPA